MEEESHDNEHAKRQVVVERHKVHDIRKHCHLVIQLEMKNEDFLVLPEEKKNQSFDITFNHVANKMLKKLCKKT